jgi:hypothetical protein
MPSPQVRPHPNQTKLSSHFSFRRKQVRTAQCCPLPDIIAQLLLAVKGLFWLLSKLKAPPPFAGVGHRHLRFAMPKKPRKLGSKVVPVKGLSKKYFGKLLKFRESLYKNQFLGYNRRRKTMTFLQRKNAGTESELSGARRTKVPALGSWM